MKFRISYIELIFAMDMAEPCTLHIVKGEDSSLKSFAEIRNLRWLNRCVHLLH